MTPPKPNPNSSGTPESIPIADFITTNMQRRSAAQSEAKQFDQAVEKQKQAEVKQRSTMEEMAGSSPASFTRTRHSDGKTLTFIPLPPKLGALPGLIRDLTFGDNVTEVDMLLALATLYLYVEDAKTKQKRRATHEEVTDFLDMDDLPQLEEWNERYLNRTLNKINTKNA